MTDGSGPPALSEDTVDVALQGDVPDGDELASWLSGAARELLTAARGVGELPAEPCELSLLLCDDAVIAELNGTWRGRPRPTDVLSFPLQEGPVLGDVVISVPTAATRVDEPRWSLRDEVAFLLVHGLLHLLGHDHEEDGERQAMEAAEQALWTASGRVGTLR